MAIVMRGLELAVADPERQARSVTMHFLRAPAARAGDRHGAEVERSGRSLTSVSGRLEQEGKLLGLALAAYSKPWAGPLLDESPMPVVAAPRPGGQRPSSPPRCPPPPFTERMVMQPRFGDPSFSRADRSRDRRLARAPRGAAGRRARGRGAGRRLVPGSVAAAQRAGARAHDRPHRPLPIAAPAPRARCCSAAFNSRHVRDGFFEEDGELWSPDGTLVAQSRQLGLLIGAQA